MHVNNAHSDLRAQVVYWQCTARISLAHLRHESPGRPLDPDE